MNKTVTILGINGHVGRATAQAFAAAGWRVIGFGRANRNPLPGVEFIPGDAENVADMRRAVAEADVVFNALNLPYDKWGNGAAEALMGRVIEAVADQGKTLLFPGNIYNYSATDRVITPGLPQKPQTERGAIRVRMEAQLEAAANAGRLQAIILRAGNFYGSALPGDWFDQLILREAGKDRVTLNPARTVRTAWAYLPDLAQAFLALAEHRESFAAFETFHFAGHLASADDLFAAIQKAVPQKLTRNTYPWLMLTLMGVFMPVIRGLVEMRYLWEYEMGLQDPRLDALLGSDFGTPLDTAIAATARPYFEKAKAAA